MDLLTVVMHEMGHLLGIDHNRSGLMADTLATGVRKVPIADLAWAAMVLDELYSDDVELDNLVLDSALSTY